MKTTDELRALAALAEAASFGGEFQQWTVIDGESTMDWRQTPSAESAYPNNVAFLRAASPDVVSALVTRVLKAEAIVRDLAAIDMGDVAPIKDGIAKVRALWRRAVALTLPAPPPRP